MATLAPIPIRVCLRLVLALCVLPPTARTHARPSPASPPDARLGERLDGRAPPAERGRFALAVPRLLLLPPRFALHVVLDPVVRVSALVEEKHLIARARDVLTSEDGKLGVRPTATYETGFLPALGLRYFDRRTLGPGTYLGLRMRTLGPDRLDAHLRLSSPPLARSATSVHARIDYDRGDDALFAGLHGESRADLSDLGQRPARYAYRRGTARAWALTDVDSWRTLSLGAAVDVRTYANGVRRGDDPPFLEVFEPSRVPGFDGGLRALQGFLEIRHDSRPGRHAGGSLLSATGRYSRGILGDPSQYFGVDAVARANLRLQDRTLIFAMQGGLVENLSDAPLPFEALLAPNSTDGLRGLATGRLRGRSALVFTLEYRWLVAPLVDAAFFVDYGGAFERRFDELSLDRLSPSVGIALLGYHARHEDRFWEGVQLAWAKDEGVRLLLSVTE